MRKRFLLWSAVRSNSTDAASSASFVRVPRVGGRIPSLDGLRALSILLVLLAHLIGTRHFAVVPELGRWQLGNLGVRVFFVISGFLITTLLLEESDRTGTVSLGQFYLRRCFRIFPVFYVFCAVLLVLQSAQIITLRPGDLIATLTYTMNYHHDRSWYVGHIWSLSVEEQFYLFWPAILLFAGVRGGLRVAMLVVLAAPSLRLAMGIFPSLRPGIGETFPTVADALAAGCVLAGLRPWLSSSPRWNRFFDSPLFWLAPIAVVACARNPSAKLDWLVGQTVMNVGIVLIIEKTIRMPNDRLGRILNTRPLVFIGTLSYSLYLWQQVFLHRQGNSPLQSFPWNLILAGLAAIASYYLVERPFLRLRVYLERRYRRTTRVTKIAPPTLVPPSDVNDWVRAGTPLALTLHNVEQAKLPKPTLALGSVVRVTGRQDKPDLGSKEPAAISRRRDQQPVKVVEQAVVAEKPIDDTL